MQDPSLYSHIKSQVDPQPQFPEQEHLKCPRCDSTNTKFCYFNNYNLSQPRHYCKNCRRYWTKGGALRNIPVGGGSRKNAKRSPNSSASASKRPTTTPPGAPVSDTHSESRSRNSASDMTETATPVKEDDAFVGHFGNLIDGTDTFASLLGTSGGQFGHFINGMAPHGSSMVDHFGDRGPGQNMDRLMYGHGSINRGGDEFLGIHGGGNETDCWGGGGGWPDLGI